MKSIMAIQVATRQTCYRHGRHPNAGFYLQWGKPIQAIPLKEIPKAGPSLIGKTVYRNPIADARYRELNLTNMSWQKHFQGKPSDTVVEDVTMEGTRWLRMERGLLIASDKLALAIEDN